MQEKYKLQMFSLTIHEATSLWNTYLLSILKGFTLLCLDSRQCSDRDEKNYCACACVCIRICRWRRLFRTQACWVFNCLFWMKCAEELWLVLPFSLALRLNEQSSSVLWKAGRIRLRRGWITDGSTAEYHEMRSSRNREKKWWITYRNWGRQRRPGLFLRKRRPGATAQHPFATWLTRVDELPVIVSCVKGKRAA